MDYLLNPDVLSDGIQISDLEGNLVYINQVSSKRLGIPQEDVKKYKVSDFEVYFKNQEKWQSHISDLREKDSVIIESINVNRITGSVTPIEVTVRIGLINESEYVIAVSRDISERIKNRKERERISRLQEILMEIASTYINLPAEKYSETVTFSLSQLARFIKADRAQIFEYDYEKNMVCSSKQWVSIDLKQKNESIKFDIDSIQNWLDEHRLANDIYIPDLNLLVESEKNALINYLNAKSLLSIPLIIEEECVGFIIFEHFKSTTNYSKSERELLWLFARMLSLVRLRFINQEKLNNLIETTTKQYNRLSEYSFITSHSVRASVANIAGLVNLIKQEPDSQNLIHHLDKSTENLDTTLKQVSELLDFEVSDRILEKNYYNLRQIIEKVISTHGTMIEQSKVHVQINMSENLYAYAYRAYLDSILFNLINNALKFGITKSNKEIIISATFNKNRIEIGIQDFGIGMDLKQVGERVFGIGYQFHKNYKGQGFGLFIVKKQLEALGGTIKVESKPNKGALFSLTLPGRIGNTQ